MNRIKLINKELLEARKKSLASFSEMDYRLESLGVINGVEWINDSKATDLESTHYALSLIEQPIIWIVESSTLQKDYSIFEKLARYKVKTIICYGAYETNIKYTLAGVVEGYAHKKSLAEAVFLAQEVVKEKEVVLFSPACPTNDIYNSYKERGQEFSLLVMNLKK